MKNIFIILLTIIFITEGTSQYLFNFTNKKEDAIILLSSYSSKGEYNYSKVYRENGKLFEETFSVNDSVLEVFKDSLLVNDYKLKKETKPIKRPDYKLRLTSYNFSYSSTKGDSIFEFTYDIILFPHSKKEKIISSDIYQSFSTQKELENNFNKIDIYNCSYIHKGTSIKRMWFDLEKVSKKPFIYFDDGTIMDYNYSASVMY